MVLSPLWWHNGGTTLIFGFVKFIEVIQFSSNVVCQPRRRARECSWRKRVESASSFVFEFMSVQALQSVLNGRVPPAVILCSTRLSHTSASSSVIDDAVALCSAVYFLETLHRLQRISALMRKKRNFHSPVASGPNCSRALLIALRARPDRVGRGGNPLNFTRPHVF